TNYRTSDPKIRHKQQCLSRVVVFRNMQFSKAYDPYGTSQDPYQLQCWYLQELNLTVIDQV
ncbi:hypothetical protein ABTP05_19145, partial [Acinetobacter baumannii]